MIPYTARWGWGYTKNLDEMITEINICRYLKRWRHKHRHEKETTFTQSYKDEYIPNMKKKEIYARINKYCKWNMKKNNVDGWERIL